MPPVVAFVAANYFAVELALIGLTLFDALIVSYALYSNYQARKSAKGGGNEQQIDRNGMVREPITPRRTIYGQCRVSGPITFAHSTDANTYINLVITLAGHEVAAIDDIFLNEELLEINPAGDVAGKYAGYVNIYKGLGSTGGDAALRTALEANCPGVWTVNHKQTGCAKLYIRLKFNVDLFSSGIPNVSAMVRGKKIFDPRDAQTRWTPNAALCVRDHLLDTVMGVGAPSSEIDDTAFIAAANICDELVARAAENETFVVPRLSPSVPSALQGQFTAVNIELGNYSYVVTFKTATGESIPSGASTVLSNLKQGTDNESMQIVVTVPRYNGADYVVTSREIYRSDKTNVGPYKFVGSLSGDGSTEFTDDVADAARGANAPSSDSYAAADVLVRTTEKYHRTGDVVRVSSTGALPAGLAAATDYYWIYTGKLKGKLATTFANAIAGTAIDITGFGSGTHTVTRQSEQRYSCDGTVGSNESPESNLRALLTASAGKLMNIGGKWIVYTGAYRNPTITLDENDVDGPIRVTSRLSRRDIFNSVKGVFVDPENDWQRNDFPPVLNATYKTEDNNEQIWSDVQLSFTTSAATAQRISKIELEANRQQITTAWPCKLTALRVQAGDVVNLTNTRLGWSAKPFEVVDFKFAVRGGDAPRLGVDLILRETASAVYAWNSGEETTLDPAPNTTLPDPFIVAAPANLVLQSGTAQLYLRLDGTVFSRIKVSWNAIADSFVSSGGSIEIQFKKSSDSVWQIANAENGSSVSTYILDVQDGQSYHVRGRAVNVMGVSSPWTTGTHTVVGKTAPPANVTGFSAGQNDNVVLFRWDQVADADLAGYEIRYIVQGQTTWDAAISLTKVTRGTQITTAAVPPGTWNFLIKARDTTGNYSTNVTVYSLTVTNTYDVIVQTDQAPDWLGTLTNFVRHWTGVLVPDSQNLASMGGWATFDTYVPNPYATSTYESVAQDLGAVFDVRVWASFAGALGPGQTGYINPKLQIDYHSGAGYDGYEDWTIGAVKARYFKQRFTVAVADGLGYMSSFKPTLDVQPHEERGAVTVAIGGTAVVFTNRYYVTPNIQLTPRGGTALFPSHYGQSGTGFSAKVFDAAGADVGGAVDWRSFGD